MCVRSGGVRKMFHIISSGFLDENFWDIKCECINTRYAWIFWNPSHWGWITEHKHQIRRNFLKFHFLFSEIGWGGKITSEFLMAFLMKFWKKLSVRILASDTGNFSKNWCPCAPPPPYSSYHQPTNQPATLHSQVQYGTIVFDTLC